MLALATGLCTAPAVQAQTQPASTSVGWQACAANPDTAARLTCFDQWAQQQQVQPGVVSPAGAAASVAQGITPPAAPIIAGVNGCQDTQYSPLSRFWELQDATDCGTFELRGYRPISLAVAASDGVNRQPSSDAPDHTAPTAVDYQKNEARIQLSARVKVAKNILVRDDAARSDSLWVGFSQQSYWQFFNGTLSRPFRTTDYEPEAMYVYPLDLGLPGGMKVRYGGLGISHQSNGRELPLSRSWNRVYAMAGMDLDNKFSLEGRIWQRLNNESGGDDNPGIEDYIGHGELKATWYADVKNTFSGTVRGLLFEDKGSLRLEYFRALGKGNRPGGLNDLRLHVQAFSGYGDSLLDYNRKRNVVSIGLALVDW
ncbi:phospholipase A [uncultured Ramlibacter sp.]|uniref:phospholipase A n=1 Tax=uncultured Ramlibacter sp. TaxID=260755 RepID=UPI00260FC00A|nr:phospholipase A [uncultured Ramlibacter sp.]